MILVLGNFSPPAAAQNSDTRPANAIAPPESTPQSTSSQTGAVTQEGSPHIASEVLLGAESQNQSRLLSQIRQLTFEGKRTGEGYFSQDGSQMVFQSERQDDNPFYQIYWMDLQTGDTHRVSPGIGKTTCAWIHPSGQQILFASTQYDPQAIDKQQQEIDFRASGEIRRYTWDYDPTYDLVEFEVDSGDYRRLTDSVGYDAEGSYSPDGSQICFASNRRAYTGELSAKEQALFDIDPASAMDLYIMDRDGSNLQRLTTAIGYDGGPFFSADGQKICWRRFDESGALAEIMVMNRDGSEQRAITQLGAMSWAPYFHPSGDYLIFTTNVHGFSNFELYLVDTAGAHDPVRVTSRDGFDGLPVFTPNGTGLVWTSNGNNSQSQLFEAQWNDAAARELLELDAQPSSSGAEVAQESARSTVPGFTAADIGRHVDYLCRPELGGRLTGTEGERKATAYVAAYLENLGLQPAGQDGTFFHEFEFVSDVRLGDDNSLTSDGHQYTVDEDWRPVFFSREGAVAPTEVVFAGYGIVAPEEQGQAEYDSYVHLDVQDKWVLVFRQMPQDISPERRQHLARYSGERYKAMVARDRGAAGLIFVSGPTSPVRSRLLPLQMDGTLGGSSLSVVTIADDLAGEWMQRAGESLAELQQELDSGDPSMGFALPGVTLAAQIDIEPITSHGRNVLALLPSGEKASAEMIVVGAHIDHLGTGKGSGSLAKEEEQGGVHRGADDNASGVAAILEVAQYLAQQSQDAKLDAKRDILLAAWSGEELGLRGSQAFVDDFSSLFPERVTNASTSTLKDANPHSDIPAHTPEALAHHAHETTPTTLYPNIAACLNLDMVGRLRDSLVLQGIGSSNYWAGAIERRNAVVRLSLTLQNDCHLPTDASSFFMRGVPILSAFTGSHSEYHTPRDVPELLNYEGAAQVAKLMGLIARDLVQADAAPDYHEQPAQPEMRANLAAYLGTVPDYAQTDIQGLKLSGVTAGAPAADAGLLAGDIIVELAGKQIENIYDYTYAIEALKIGQPTKVKIKRGDETLELEIIPGSRQ
ncbi:M20/M25/M40 family metallo-hydrolase [Aureliella helgolandensis]|uniref:M20/M25/M40 family metallo-hydrolase n=1 Tax=Aureliella helgolandensis TaxID=2527968 RepID=UPI0018D0CEF3|nr:M20/M25/M40 family metallo-hydrolase [Aureliella helgolandensis]